MKFPSLWRSQTWCPAGKPVGDGKILPMFQTAFATWNIGTTSDKSLEVVETVHRWKIDVCYVQETRWKGSGTKVIGKGVSEYKLFWQGCKESDAGVGILISGKLIDKVDDVKRVNERILCLVSWSVSGWWPASVHMHLKWVELQRIKTVSGIICSVYQGAYWHWLELIVVGRDLKGHVGASADGYDWVHGGYGRELLMVSDY